MATSPHRPDREDSSLECSPRDFGSADAPNSLPGDPSKLSNEQMARIAKAIADPQRFAILECIAARHEIPCKVLVAEFPITQATISHHLKELVAAELITSRREGQMAILSCRRGVCEAYTRALADCLLAPVMPIAPTDSEQPQDAANRSQEGEV